MSIPIISVGLQAIGLATQVAGANRAANAADDKGEALAAGAALREEAGDLELEAIATRGVADADAALFRAGVARDNARTSAIFAEDAIVRGETDAVMANLAAKQIIGEQRATIAANGVVVDAAGSSALNLVEDSFRVAKINAMTIKSNSEREALSLRQAGKNFESEALLLTTDAGNILEGTELALEASRIETEADVLATLAQIQVAKATSSATQLSSFGSSLTGAGQVASQWFAFKQQGAFD